MSVSAVNSNSVDLSKLLQTNNPQQATKANSAASQPADADGDHDGSTAQDAAAEGTSHLNVVG